MVLKINLDILKTKRNHDNNTRGIKLSYDNRSITIRLQIKEFLFDINYNFMKTLLLAIASLHCTFSLSLFYCICLHSCSYSAVINFLQPSLTFLFKMF